MYAEYEFSVCRGASGEHEDLSREEADMIFDEFVEIVAAHDCVLGGGLIMRTSEYAAQKLAELEEELDGSEG